MNQPDITSTGRRMSLFVPFKLVTNMMDSGNVQLFLIWEFSAFKIYLFPGGEKTLLLCLYITNIV